MKQKKLTKKAGLTIPKDTRAAVGFLAGDVVDIIQMGNGVFIKKHVDIQTGDITADTTGNTTAYLSAINEVRTTIKEMKSLIEPTEEETQNGEN